MTPEVNLHTLADAAGVSIATVSRALTGRGRVSGETASRIRELAEELGYHVNSVGKALREGSTRSFGMVVPVIANPFYSTLIRAVEDELQQLDFELVIADSHGEVERESRRLRLLRGQRVQGIILVAADAVRSGDAVREVAQTLPLVCVDRRVDGIDVDFVGVDNALGIRLILDHLAERGVHSVALASSDNVTSAGQERHRAFASYTRELGLRVLPPVINAFDVETGLHAGTVFGARAELPDAIVAGDDLIALGLISSLGVRGIRVPRDVLVTGFDGTYLAAIVEPGITTVEQPIREIASHAVSSLIGQQSSGGCASARNVTLPPSLAVRRSTEVTAAATL